MGCDKQAEYRRTYKHDDFTWTHRCLTPRCGWHQRSDTTINWGRCPNCAQWTFKCPTLQNVTFGSVVGEWYMTQACNQWFCYCPGCWGFHETQNAHCGFESLDVFVLKR